MRDSPLLDRRNIILSEDRLIVTPQLTITAGRATFAVIGMSTAAAGTSAVILATGGAALLIGGGIYLATRNSQTRAPRLEEAVADKL